MRESQARPAPARADPIGQVSGVREAAGVDSPTLVMALARGYYEDPVFGWYFPDDSRRLQQLQRMFALFAAQVFGYGGAYTTAGIVGGAMWLSPDKWRLCPFTRLAVVHGLASGVGLRHVPRALRGLYLTQSRHPHQPPHCHLPFIGVEPQWQSKGVGTALLQPILARCDREGLPAHVEATSPRNRAFLERNGFEVIQQIALRAGPPMWPMWRKPAHSNSTQAGQTDGKPHSITGPSGA